MINMKTIRLSAAAAAVRAFLEEAFGAGPSALSPAAVADARPGADPGAPASRGGRVLSVLRDPIVVFFVVSIVIFLMHYARVNARDEVIVTQGAVRALVDNFELMRGREASTEEIAELEAEYLRDELLFLEALDAGAHYTEPKAREILVDAMKRRFAGEDATPTMEELIDFYTTNAALYTTERAYSFGQIFFLNPPEEPQDILRRLNRGELVKGDPFWQGSDFQAYGVSILRGVFSAQFVDALERAPVDRWIGPVETGRGWHFLVLREAHEPALLPFAQVQNQVENDLRTSIAMARIEGYTAELQKKYVIRYER